MSAVLDQRETKKGTAKGSKFLTFKLADHSYGVNVLQIREIIRVMEITPLPQMPEYVRGVINLRGRVIPVVDLRLKFSMPIKEHDERTCIIVVQITSAAGGVLPMGLFVDAVEEVVNISEEDLEPAPEFGTTMESSCIQGLAKVKGVVKTLLDIDRVIKTDALENIEAAATVA